MKRAIAIWALAASAAMAQSTVTGSKTMQGSWDASGATATKPAKSGASLPSSCSIGEFFFNTVAAAGQNLYLCDPVNTWNQLSSGGSGGVSNVFGRTGAVSAQSGDYNFSQLSGSATPAQLPATGGDLSGTIASATVKAIQGQSLSAAAPSAGQVLTWGGASWAPQNPAGISAGIAEALVFDGSTTALMDGSTVSWASCGSNAQCANWTVPANISWVRVQVWSAGGSGMTGFGGGSSSGAGGGGGGGYFEGVCAVNSGASVTVTVGLGGVGIATSPWSNDGGNSAVANCVTAVGGAGGNNPTRAQFGGYVLSGLPSNFGWVYAEGSNTNSYDSWVHAQYGNCTYAGAPGSIPIRPDGGGCGAGANYSSGMAGWAGGSAIYGGGGGGTGGFNNATGGAGGTSAFGGAGGAGGGWTAAGGIVNCTAGSAPGGGGGAGGSETDATSLTGCGGARGEVRIYYVR